MAVSDYRGKVTKLRAIIRTVDPSQLIIEAMTKDGQPHRLAVFEVKSGFQWPKEGEEWTIINQGGLWYLGDPLLNTEEMDRLKALSPGERYWSQADIDQLKDLLGLV